MNTLVGYESSGEEDGIEESKFHHNDPLEANSGHAPHQFLSQTAVPDAPMVGPFQPKDNSQDYYQYGDENDDMTNTLLTEKGVIRHLTQASHPMTEMPPSPTGSPDPSVAAKFKHFLDLKGKSIHFNENLARKSAFRNPALLQTLTDRAGLDLSLTHETSLPRHVFDANSFPAIGYKEALLKSQQTIRAKEEAEKKALSAAGKRTLEFTAGGVSTIPSATSSTGGLSKRQRQ